MKYDQMLKCYFQPIAAMIKKYPKAGKKNRNIKKWRRRFGDDIDFSHMINLENNLLSMIREVESYEGSYFAVPVEYKVDE